MNLEKPGMNTAIGPVSVSPVPQNTTNQTLIPKKTPECECFTVAVNQHDEAEHCEQQEYEIVVQIPHSRDQNLILHTTHFPNSNSPPLSVLLFGARMLFSTNSEASTSSNFAPPNLVPAPMATQRHVPLLPLRHQHLHRL